MFQRTCLQILATVFLNQMKTMTSQANKSIKCDSLRQKCFIALITFVAFDIFDIAWSVCKVALGFVWDFHNKDGFFLNLVLLCIPIALFFALFREDPTLCLMTIVLIAIESALRIFLLTKGILDMRQSDTESSPHVQRLLLYQNIAYTVRNILSGLTIHFYRLELIYNQATPVSNLGENVMQV